MWNKSQNEEKIELVVFKSDHAPVIAGVTCTKVEAGWKNCEMNLDKGGIIIDVPGYKSVFVHLSNTRQVDFSV